MRLFWFTIPMFLVLNGCAIINKKDGYTKIAEAKQIAATIGSFAVESYRTIKKGHQAGEVSDDVFSKATKAYTEMRKYHGKYIDAIESVKTAYLAGLPLNWQEVKEVYKDLIGSFNLLRSIKGD